MELVINAEGVLQDKEHGLIDARRWNDKMEVQQGDTAAVN